jgi:hypothetical protein
MGNFGLYIAAAVTAGVSREAAEITDEDLREFANCEGDSVKVNTDVFYKVKDNSKALKRNVNVISVASSITLSGSYTRNSSESANDS